jgi:hypothetical protein
MTPEEARRNVLVKEIEWWRRSKLLPEPYCDFLLNLYLDDLEERPKTRLEAVVRRIGRATPRQWFLSLSIFSLICLPLLYFNAFPPALQMTVIAGATGGCVAFAARWRTRAPVHAQLILGTGMLFLLGAGLAMLAQHGWLSAGGWPALLAVCAVAWVVCGLAFRHPVLHAGGWLLAATGYALLLAERLEHPGWLDVQLCWLPLAVLFGWLSWFLHGRIPRAGAALLVTALVLWYMPEIFSALADVDRPWIPLQFLVKTALIGFGLFRFRRHWIQWVA